MSRTSLILCIFLICTLSPGEAHAQKKAVGATFSYAGIGLVYEHGAGDGSFMDVQLRMETSSMFKSRKNLPGVSASLTWNMVFAETEARDGSRLTFFAGPGAVFGFNGDIGSRKGIFMGMKGKIGGECTFNRNVNVSISVSPVLGLHLSTRGDAMNMLIYKNGLLYGIMPEIGIKYAF